MTTSTGAAQAAPFAIRLADGAGRLTQLDIWLEYLCPWCEYVVPSPEGHRERQRVSREYAALAGETFVPQPYPAWDREVYERRGCANPACLANMTLPRLQAWRLAEADRQAEAERRAGIARWYENYRAESAERERVAWEAARAEAEAAGHCLACLRASFWQTHPRRVAHRDPANCPNKRRYAAA